MKATPFTINIAQTVLDDLQERLARTRWPDQVAGSEWEYGTNLDYLKRLVDYWQHGFDWRAQEAKLNQFAHFKADIDGRQIPLSTNAARGQTQRRSSLHTAGPDRFLRS